MYYVGLDLGQKQDFTAVAVVEREEQRLAWMPAPSSLQVRHLERMELGTPYTEVVERVREIMRHPDLHRRSQLVVDATGVGAPVVDLLRSARIGCSLTAVTITGGERAQCYGGEWHVPRKDLLAGIEVLLESGELKISGQLAEAERLVRELTSLRLVAGDAGRRRAEPSGEHDDLVIAVGLACWQAKQMTIGFRTQSLGL